jgi:hypothetical protein
MISQRIDEFLASRGLSSPVGSGLSRTATDSGSSRTATSPPNTPAEFVCEDDVRQALRSGYKIVINSRTIVTPAARDLGDEKRIFTESR